MVGEDPRRTRSRAALIASITELMDAGATPSITEIVARAGVSRPTFYQHFGDLPTAFSAAALERLESQFALIAVPADGSVDEKFTTRAVSGLLEHLRHHRDFYRAVLADATKRGFTDSTVAFLADRIIYESPFGAALRADADEYTTDRITTLAAGLMWLITQWLYEEPTVAQTVDRMTARIIAVLAFFTDPSTSRSSSSSLRPMSLEHENA